MAVKTTHGVFQNTNLTTTHWTTPSETDQRRLPLAPS